MGLLERLRCAVRLLRVPRIIGLSVAVWLTGLRPSRRLIWCLRLRGSFVTWRRRVSCDYGVPFGLLCGRRTGVMVSLAQRR